MGESTKFLLQNLICFKGLTKVWHFLASFDFIRETRVSKVEKVLKDSMDLIPSPPPVVKIQIMGGKVCLRCKGKTLLAILKSTTPSNVLPYYLK